MIGERSLEIGIHCLGLLPHLAPLNPDSMPTLSAVDPDILTCQNLLNSSLAVLVSHVLTQVALSRISNEPKVL